MTKTLFLCGKKPDDLPIDPFPAPEKLQHKYGCWIYGRAEREIFLHRKMIRAKDKAHLNVGYPGEFMPQHGTMHFRAMLPADVFPVVCIGTPALSEIRMTSPGKFEFTLSVPDTEHDVPCFRCNADVVWEASADGIEWHDASRAKGGDEPPHRAELASLQITPTRMSDGKYDLGREIFGRVWIRHAPAAKLFVGESIPEVENRNPEYFEQRLDLIRKDAETLCSAVPLAFRYLSLEHAEEAEVQVEALYTPLTMRKRFSCGDEELDAIWERSAYTLHLCTQNFLLDGVKRDRLPWAGDLAVSLLGMTESFNEPGPIRDTLAVLGSAGIRNTHINGITDYSLWYLINFELYERFFDDPPFLRQEYFRIIETAELLLAQRLDNGLLPLDGWVLIDWAEGDKNCALQVLFFMALRSLSRLAERIGDREHAEKWSGLAAELRETIRRDFYDPASGLFRCSPWSDEFLRHQNFLAVAGQIRGGVTSEYQTNSGLAAYSLHQSGNRGGTVWDVRFSDKYAHAFRNAADGLVPGTQLRERAASGKVGLNREWGFSRLTLGYYHLTPGMTEGYEDGDLDGPTGYAVELPFQQVHHYKAVLDNSFVMGPGSLKLLIGLQRNRRQEFEEEADEAELDFRLSTMNYDVRYTTDEFADGWRLAAGVGGMYQESDNLGEEVLIPAYRLFDAGLFVTTTKNWDRFTLAGGVRADMRHLSSLYLEDKFDAFERDFTGVTGSIGLVYSPARNLNLRANVARGFRAPNLSELASNGVHEGTVRYEKGNSRLDPEFSLQGDLGADLQLQHVSLTAALFCNRIDNYIYALCTGVVTGGYDEYRYDATDALLYGAELAADCHPFHALHLGADFSYVRGKFQSSDMPLIPAPKVGAEVKWEITHSGKILNNSYLSMRADHHFRQDHFLQGTETATDAYLLLGASAHTDIMCKGKCVAQLSLVADNLTDKVYVDHLSRLKYVGIRNPGRNITLKLNIPL